MAMILMKLGKKYVAWSTSWDRPVKLEGGGYAAFDTPAELEAFVVAEAVRHAEEREREDFPRRLERLERLGTSHMIESLGGTVACNRAGPDEASLTFDQLVALVGG